MCFGWRSLGEQAGRAIGIHTIFILMSRIYVSTIELFVVFSVGFWTFRYLWNGTSHLDLLLTSQRWCVTSASPLQMFLSPVGVSNGPGCLCAVGTTNCTKLLDLVPANSTRQKGPQVGFLLLRASRQLCSHTATGESRNKGQEGSALAVQTALYTCSVICSSFHLFPVSSTGADANMDHAENCVF